MNRNNANSLLILGLLLGLGACTTPNIKTSDKNGEIKIEEAQPIEKPIALNDDLKKDNSDDMAKKYADNYSKLDDENTVDAKMKLKTLSIQDIGDRIYFPTDSFTLTPQAREVLAKQAHFLMARPSLKAVIAGNCDERGTREYNIALGARRANAVKDYLISLGVNPSQVSTISYGKERPIDARPSLDGWAVNRNAQTKIQ